MKIFYFESELIFNHVNFLSLNDSLFNKVYIEHLINHQLASSMEIVEYLQHNDTELIDLNVMVDGKIIKRTKNTMSIIPFGSMDIFGEYRYFNILVY